METEAIFYNIKLHMEVKFKAGINCSLGPSCTHLHSDHQEGGNPNFHFFARARKSCPFCPFLIVSHGSKITTDLKIYIQLVNWLVPVHIPAKCHLVI